MALASGSLIGLMTKLLFAADMESTTPRVTMNGFNANPNYGYSTNPSVTDLTNGRQAAFSLDNGFPQSAVSGSAQISSDT